jgi:hypothetical protein
MGNRNIFLQTDKFRAALGEAICKSVWKGWNVFMATLVLKNKFEFWEVLTFT